ncbi:16S rRNA (uracil(1498)-N(3))-methyltransferase [Marinimicrobium alkaliphilum]|uniref:16S rRNA (uracil(1498)-N(3))-methyltransferase n=1 Tax=Marinimicrobium alkaliphilum TaxID=2202654 RepID=UPI000DBAA5BA|nr:16S rRNA (uracil(1498)-N(3))-methyltransferase [Marinimicrobium alkaliphilum]
MNLIILHPDDFTQPDVAHLRDARRCTHIRDVHRAQPGDELRVGVLNGALGRGRIITLDQDGIVLQITQEREPPPMLPLTLVLALPRPMMLKRIFQTVATLGVQELILLHSKRVEKSFWQTPLLAPEAIAEQLLLGLEQGGATQLPKVRFEKRFRGFVEDQLPALTQDRLALVAHPYDAEPCPAQVAQPTLLAIGPEGGFIDYEIEKLRAAGLAPVHLGPRIQRVETAVTFLLGRLF